MAKKTDSNQQSIIDHFRQLGYSVKDMSAVGQGFPDLIVSKMGDNILIEVKTESGKLTTDQMKFISLWNSAVYLVRDAEDILLLEQGMLMPISLTNEQLKKII